MSKFLSGVVTWFQGKKTILGGILVIGAAAAGEWFGKIDPATALALGGIGFAAVGLGDRANRHQAELLTALQGIATAGADFRAGNAAGALKAVESTAATIAAPELVAQVSNLGASTGASIHISADSTSELLAAIQGLAGSGPATTTASVPGTAAVDTQAPAATPAKAALA